MALSPRVVTQIYLDRDRRGRSERPLASDVLLSFWKYVAQRPVRSLKEIVFQTVEEPSTQEVRREVYTVLGENASTTVRLRPDNHGELFNRVLKDTKLGKCARTIAAEYIEMKDGHAQVAQFKFKAQDPHGYYFYLAVTLDYQRQRRAR